MRGRYDDVAWPATGEAGMGALGRGGWLTGAAVMQVCRYLLVYTR